MRGGSIPAPPPPFRPRPSQPFTPTKLTPVSSLPTDRGSAREVFWAFLKLGLTSFGGPIAHLGYFRTAFVARRRWLSDQAYADLVALCQFLPGPASSQVGFGLGWRRAGLRGALAAFLAFTLPSALLMLLAAYGSAVLPHDAIAGIVSGLKIVAVAVVAQAVWGMARALTPDLRRLAIAALAATAAILFSAWGGQLIALGIGALGGWWLCRDLAGRSAAPATSDGVPGTHPARLAATISRRIGIAALAGAATLLVVTPILTGILDPARTTGLAVFDAFSRAGALVFGGGHVVLPLVHSGVVDSGWVSESQFLAGYGAAQAVPGPLFTFAAYLGALASAGPGGAWGALIAIIAIFLPGFLLLVGVLPFWSALQRIPSARAVLHGMNASVVGILAAALITPVGTSALLGPWHVAVALLCLSLLMIAKLPPWVVVLLGAVGGVAIHLLA